MLIHANGYAFDMHQSRFDALVYDRGRVVAVGSRSDLELMFSRRIDQVIDVDGATVIPGLVDSHLHISGVGQMEMLLNLFDVTSKAQLLERIRSWRQHLSEDEWIVGVGWDENRFADKAIPTLQELDDAAGGRPLLLSRVCYHAYLANSRAFELAGLGMNPDDPEDGRYGRDANGQLNGLVYENASEPIRRAIPEWPASKWKEALRRGMQKALAAGLTAVHTDDVRSFQSFASTWQAYHELIREERIPLRVHELVDYHYIDECLKLFSEMETDEWLEIGAAKLFSDGAMGGRTAWLLEPYSDAENWHGTPMYSREELAYRVKTAHEKGFAVAIHAIGDAGLDATLQALEEAPPVRPLPFVKQRDRVVHAELVNPNLVRRMAALGPTLAVDIQPRFTVSDFPWVQDRVGRARTPFVCAWRMLMDAGLRLAGGSDAPIEPIEPLLGIHAAVVRRKPFETHDGYEMSQALRAEEAVRLFTHDACYANESERYKGVIAPGWVADFTVIDRDIVRPDHPDDIRDAKVWYTIVGGRTAYSADGVEVERI
jgi:predicted amidohydrolase YtcJ